GREVVARDAAAGPLAPVVAPADLVQLRGVDADEPDTLLAQPEAVAVRGPGHADKTRRQWIEVSRDKRERKEQSEHDEKAEDAPPPPAPAPKRPARREPGRHGPPPPKCSALQGSQLHSPLTTMPLRLPPA